MRNPFLSFVFASAFILGFSGSSLAADGTLVVEVAKASDGKLLPADISVYKNGALVKTFTALTGEGQTALPGGHYDLKATAKGGFDLTGTLAIDLLDGKVMRFRMSISTPVSTASFVTSFAVVTPEQWKHTCVKGYIEGTRQQSMSLKTAVPVKCVDTISPTGR